METGLAPGPDALQGLGTPARWAWEVYLCSEGFSIEWIFLDSTDLNIPTPSHMDEPWGR